jgi:hypothetical protein
MSTSCAGVCRSSPRSPREALPGKRSENYGTLRHTPRPHADRQPLHTPSDRPRSTPERPGRHARPRAACAQTRATRTAATNHGTKESV